MSDDHVIVVRYGLSTEARKVFAKATGSLDLNDAPSFPTFPGVHFIPNKGDLVRWDEISTEENFVVAQRLFRFRSDGGMEIDLMIEVDGRE